MSGLAILTTTGLAKVASATPINQLRITHVAIGDGTNILDPNSTTLVNEVYRSTASTPIRSSVYPDTIVFELIVPPTVGGFTTREIGAFDDNGDMIAVGTLDEIIKPLDGVNLTARIHVKLSNAAQVDVFYVDTSVEAALLARSRLSEPVTLVDGQSEVTFAGFNASLSSYYLSAPLSSDVPSQRLFPDKHYTFADSLTETIALQFTAEAGWDIYASSLDPTGTTIVPSESQFQTVGELQNNVGIINGRFVTVADLGGAVYKMSPAGTVVNVGDIVMDTLQVAVLQPLDDGSFDVRAFGVKHDPTNTLGSQIALFKDASDRAALSGSQVSIPTLTVNISGVPINNNTTWLIAPNCVFRGVPGVSPSFVYDLTQLGGRVVMMREADKFGQLYVGDASYTVQKATGRAQTTGAVVGASKTGQSGVGGYTHTSAKSTVDQGSIAVKGVALNNNQALSIITWGGYFETIRVAGAAGKTLGVESAVVNKGAVTGFDPNDLVSASDGLTVSFWGSAGIGEADDTDVSMAMGFIGQPTGSASTAKFYRGIVFQEGSVRTGEAYCLPSAYQIAWWDTRASGNNKLSYISGANPGSNRGRVAIGIRNNDAQSFEEFSFTRTAFTYSANNAVDIGGTLERFKTIYLQNAPDVVSDITKKTSITELTTNELAAGLALARNVKMFKWIDEVAEKGESSAYLHTSVMAQEAWQTLTDNGVDPTKYGFISNSADGWSVMPTELSMLMSAALVSKQDELESRLSALEAL